MFEIESNIGVDDEPIEVKTIEIGDYNYLSKISMLIKDLNKLSGLMLIDQNNDFASQANWDQRASSARQTAQTLTNTQSIVGLLVSTKNADYIPRIGFIVANLPEVQISELSFGVDLSGNNDTVQYPDEDVIPQTVYDWGYLLKEIKFQTDATNFGLQGIQFVFNNDRESEMLTAGDSQDLETYVEYIDQWSEIRHIQVLIVPESGLIEGMKLLDDDELVIHEMIWGQYVELEEEEQQMEPTGEWSESRKLPEGEFIIGLRINKGVEDGITGLVFLTTVLDD